jgi:uncharacterized membrane-anchored protein
MNTSLNTSIARALIVLGTALVLGSVNYSIFHKEGIKRNGEMVLMDLAPVDPRSLMQGDYMTLDFQVARQIANSLPKNVNADGSPQRSTNSAVVSPREGEIRLVDITLNEKRIANFSNAPAAGSLKLRYRLRGGRVWLGTNAFFFEEGRAAQYAKARYGEFRLDRTSGEAVLVGLRDEKLEAL